MARTAATVGPRTNRRFVLLALALGLVGAILVYVALARPEGGSGGGAADTPVVVARSDIPARTKITESMIEVRLVGADSKSTLAYSDTVTVVGQVTRFPIAANEQVLSSKVVALTTTGGTSTTTTSRSLSFVVPAGKRGMAVKTSDVIGAGGLVLPGDYVDVLVTYDVEFPSDPKDPSKREKADAYFTHVLIQNVEVLAVSQTVVDVVAEATPSASGQRVRNSEAKPVPDATTVTLALTPEQAQKLFNAELNGKIRLMVRPFGEAGEPPLEPMIEIDLFPRNLPNPFLR